MVPARAVVNDGRSASLTGKTLWICPSRRRVGIHARLRSAAASSVTLVAAWAEAKRLSADRRRIVAAAAAR